MMRFFLPFLMALVAGSTFAQKPAAGLASRLEIPSAEFTIGGPAVDPAPAFPATFELTNRGSAPVKVELADGSEQPAKIGFRLLNAAGDVLWSSEELLAEEEGRPAILAVGQTWKRTVAIPLFLEDGQLELGRYAVEAFVAGSPEYGSKATFRMTSDVVATAGTMPPTVSARKWGVFTSLTVADSRAVVGLRRGENVRLSGVIRSTFLLENRSTNGIGFSFSDSGANARKISFSLLDAEGNVIWKSDRSVISLPVMVDSILPAGQAWGRTLDIPLHVEGTALPEGLYTIVGEVEGSPVYRSATTIRVVNRAK